MLGAARRQSSLLHVRSCARSFLSTRVGRTAEEIIAGVLTRALEEVKREETRQHTRGVLKEEQLYEWQRTILEMVTQQQAHDRHIYWYYDEGDSGKSALAKLLVAVHGAVMCEDRAVDIKHTVARHTEEKGSCPNTVIFNLPRSAGNRLDFVGLEQVKDANFASTKYTGKQIVMQPPHVLLFANQAPQT